MNNRKILLINTYTGYFLIGTVAMIISPTLPSIIAFHEVGTGRAGLVFTAFALGILAGVLCGGIVSDTLGKKPVIAAGCMLQTAGYALVAVSGNWHVFLVSFVVAGAARGLLNSCFNALVSDIVPDRRGLALNFLHGVYGAGCLIGPFVAGYLLFLEFDWRIIYTGAAILWFVFLIFMLPLKYPSPDWRKNTSCKSVRVLLTPVFLMLFAVSFIYNGASNGLIGWLNVYTEQMDMNLLLGAGMVSLFYGGLTTGRFICGAVSEKTGYTRTILICAIGCLVSYPVAVYSGHPVLMALAVFFFGLFSSGLHPTGLAYAVSLNPHMPGTVNAFLTTALSAGTMTVPWMIGIAAGAGSLKSGLGIGVVLLAVLTGIGMKLMKKHQ